MKFRAKIENLKMTKNKEKENTTKRNYTFKL